MFMSGTVEQYWPFRTKTNTNTIHSTKTAILIHFQDNKLRDLDMVTLDCKTPGSSEFVASTLEDLHSSDCAFKFLPIVSADSSQESES